MRIISGKFRGRNILAPKNLPVRPTTDFGKTALFNIINAHFDIPSLYVLDLFSGTGNITYEFLSREVNNITCVDKDNGCVRFINETLKKLGENTVPVIKADVFKFLEAGSHSYDFIFADPPYELDAAADLCKLIFEKNLLNKNGWFVLEHEWGKDYSQLAHFIETRHYGKVAFSVFKQDL